MEVSGIWIRKEGDQVVLLFESNGTITAAMIEAGAIAFVGVDRRFDSPEEGAIRVFRAMLEAREAREAGAWYKAASEHVDGAFSHIVELNVTGNGHDAGQPRPLSEFETAP